MFNRLFPVTIGFVVAAWNCVSVAQAQIAEGPRPAPLFAGQSLPKPPRQGESWTPPKTKLPEKCVTAVEALVKYGFANPRGCEYREVEIPCGSVSSNKGFLFKTHAWVVPVKDANDAQRFAVTWSGLVYPVPSAGEPADLKADIAAFVKETMSFPSDACAEYQVVSHRGADRLKLCALLLLGETEAAEQLWNTLQTSKYAQPESDPYLRFMHEWAWAHYDRAVCAHIRGDDTVSLLSAQAAIRLRQRVEKDAAARGLERPRDNQGKPDSYLPFLNNIDRLAADEERRIKAEKVPRVLDVGVDKFPDQKQRIAALIRDLEEVNATQNSQPGAVELTFDPLLRLLVQQGEAAIDPLLDCFEKDTRLTRSVGYHRTFFTHRYFLGVDDAAFRAISDILKVRNFGPHTDHGYSSWLNGDSRADAVKEVRAYWNKMRSVSELDRWYQTLADDQASDRQWLEIAQKIVRPAPRVPGAVVPPPVVTALLPRRPLAGEGLRKKKNPSVSELLGRRADEIASHDLNSTGRIHKLADACEITLALGQWEPAIAVPEARKRVAQCRFLYADSFYGPYAKTLSSWLPRLCALGIENGDSQAAGEYAAWLTQLSPDKVEKFRTSGEFYALYRFPDEPKLAAAARGIFLDANSPWRPLHDMVDGSLSRDLLGSPLMGVPAFRDMVKQGLRNADKSAAILKANSENGSYSIDFGGGRFGRTITNASDPAAAEIKEESLRVCDLYAWSLAGFEGSPVFEPYWPQDRRDAAIAELLAFLDQWGDCFRVLPNVPFERLRFPNQVQFHVPRLDHPATPDDVNRGRAIFSLQDSKSEVRVAELPMFPQMARWKTLDKFPIRYPGQTAAQTEYDRAGYVWQAEEIQIDGKWQRFYGFVGNHIIAKVAADEIEFLQKYGDDRLLRW